MNAVNTNMISVRALILALAMLAPAAARAAEPAHKEWLAQWQKKNPTWRALHLIGPEARRMDLTGEFVEKTLAPLGFNVLVLEVNYGFQFASHASRCIRTQPWA